MKKSWKDRLRQNFFNSSLLLIFFFFSSEIRSQGNYFYANQTDTILENLNKSHITTGILYDRAFPLSRFDFFNPSTDTATFKFSVQAYYELYQAHYNRSGLLDPKKLMSMVEWENLRSYVPILILDYNYNKFDTMALDDNLISYQNGHFFDVPGRPRTPYWTQQFRIATPLLEQIETNTVTFLLLPHFISRNTGLNIQSVTADFGDGSGQHLLSGLLDSISVSYPNGGEKIVNIQVTLSNGSTFQTKSKIVLGVNNYNLRTINSSRTLGTYDPCFSQTVTANIPFQGYDESMPFSGMFKANYYYRTNDGVVCDGNQKQIKKPIILIDGFDPTDKRDAATLYEQFLFYVDDVNFPPTPPVKEYIIPELRSLGYDVILIDIPTYYHTYGGEIVPLPPNSPGPPPNYQYIPGKVIRGGGDFVQRNAFTLVKLINQLNIELASQGSNEQLVVIGPSMGGQISRYALRWMELNNQSHNCRLWVSFDSNHEGAIFPIGQQYFIDFLAGGDIEAAEIARDRQINSPASKQFLIDHYLSHSQGSISPAGAPNFYQQYYNDINNIGWPQNCRKISMISGAENGSPQNTPQGGELSYQHILKLNKRSGLLLVLFGASLFGLSEIEILDAKMYVAPTVAQGTGKVFEAKVKVLTNILTGLSSVSKYSTSSNLCRTQSLETIQGGYYWGYQELAESSGGNNTVIQGTAKIVRQFISYPTGFHTHHTSFGDLALGQGLNPNPNRKWDDDLSEVNLACDTREIPFDTYFGPTTFSVKHDSLFYWQARHLVNEIKGIPIPKKSITRTISGTNTGIMCVGNRRTFQLPNPKTGQTFLWSTSHPNLLIVNGQGTGTVEVEYTGGTIIGSAYISLQSTHTCYNISIPNLPLQIIFGPPNLVGYYTITSNYHNPGYQYPLGTSNQFFLPANQAANMNVYIANTDVSSVSWTNSGSYLVSWSSFNNGKRISFTMTAGGTPYQVRTTTFNSTSSNTCGTSNKSFNFSVVTQGWGRLKMIVSPNPADKNLKVAIINTFPELKTPEENMGTEIGLYDFRTNLIIKKWHFKNDQKLFDLDISKLASGNYILIVTVGGERLTRQIIIN